MGSAILRDIIVILPGITGSVLQRDGRDVWAPSLGALWGTLISRGAALESLALVGDDPEAEDLGDGVRATALVPNATIIPGLVKIDGYSDLVQMVRDTFRVREGTTESNEPANLIQFPYDWRRDNRSTARRLKRVVDEHLHRWRKYTGCADAKAIFITHSMGGLVARYYLEVLEGWPDCRALLTLGTPHRGSLNALASLVDGVKKAFVDMSPALRSFPSVYQLLPIYPVLQRGGDVLRVAELPDLPGIDQRRSADALTFHREIMAAVERHRADARYRDPRTGYQLLPVVGFRQPTNQSAQWVGSALSVAREVPDGVDVLLGDGDGTVPRLSAVPVELSDEFRHSFFPERHGALQRNPSVLQHVRGCLEQMQVQGLGAIRGFEVAQTAAAARPAISLDLQDLYGPAEPVTMRARLIDASATAGPPRARIEPAAGGLAATYTFEKAEARADEWTLTVTGIPSGVYRIRSDAPDARSASPPAVHDLFEVHG